MPVNPLPPQAYTKETLQKAFAWLLTQNSSVKEIAQDQNILVSLYLKAQRSGEASLDTPSIQNFKQELKSLAHIMGDFQTSQTSQSPITPSSSINSVIPSQVTPAENLQATSVSQNFNPSSIFLGSELSKDQNLNQKPLHKPIQQDLNFDSRTLTAISEVRDHLNLSSDTEAIRVLVAIGIKTFKKSQL